MESATLHTLARRYLTSRNEELRADYATLPNEGRAFVVGHTAEAKRIYPRYRVAEAMLEEVERLDPDDLPPLQPLAGTLTAAATTAQSDFTRRASRAEKKAINAERERFREAIETWLSQPGLVVEPLGYRRVLGDAESTRWRGELGRRWGMTGDWWHPLITGDAPDGVLVLRASAVWDGPATKLVRAALENLGRRRVVELREPGDPDSLLDLELFEPAYTGAEGVWTDDTLDWIAYASHEHTVAFAGTLAERLKTTWPDIDDWRWRPADWD